MKRITEGITGFDKSQLKPTVTVVSTGPPSWDLPITRKLDEAQEKIASSTTIPPVVMVPSLHAAGVDGENAFCVVTYNTLADVYNGGGILWERRRDRIKREIESVAPAIVCLQEIEAHSFAWLEKEWPHMRGHFLRNETGDGVAIFYRVDRFALSPGAKSILDVSFAPLATRFAETETEAGRGSHVLTSICQSFLSRVRHHSVACLVLLQDLVTGSKLAVATSHLYWGASDLPLNYQLQLAQAYLMMREFDAFLGERDARASPFILNGDFNSPPTGALYGFLNSGRLDAANATLNWSRVGRQDGVKAELTIPFALRSSYALATGEEPEVSCSSPGFVGLVDYIYCTPASLVVTSVLQRPLRETVINDVGQCPSLMYPSDHLMLAATFKFRTE